MIVPFFVNYVFSFIHIRRSQLLFPSFSSIIFIISAVMVYTAACLFFVMLFARKDIYCIVSDFVNKPVFIIDSSRPVAGKFVLERFGLSDSGKWISGNVFYEVFNSPENLFVCGFPIVVVFVSRFIKSNDCNHNAASSILFTLPFSISLSPSRSISLFTGLLRRYSVSSIGVSVVSALSVTVMSRIVPENIFLRPSKKSMVSSVFLSVNELCIRTSVFCYHYKRIPQKLLCTPLALLPSPAKRDFVKRLENKNFYYLVYIKIKIKQQRIRQRSILWGAIYE